MARYTFPQNRLLAAAPTGGTGLAATNGLLVRVYSDSAATMLADIQTLVGGAIPNSELTVDSTSQLPLFLGPDGVGTLYVRAVAGGPISTINARLDSILPLASDRLTMPSSLSLRVGDKLGVGLVPTRPLDVLAAGQAGFVQSTGTQNNHALTAYQSGNGAGLDNAVAANFPSDNEYASSVYVSGVQQQRATSRSRTPSRLSTTRPSTPSGSSSKAPGPPARASTSTRPTAPPPATCFDSATTAATTSWSRAPAGSGSGWPPARRRSGCSTSAPTTPPPRVCSRSPPATGPPATATCPSPRSQRRLRPDHRRRGRDRQRPRRQHGRHLDRPR